MVNAYLTIVIRNPSEAAEQEAVAQALAALQPYQVAMSLEDEMTLIECIENHDDLPGHVIQEARAQRDKIHRAAGTAA